VFVELGACAMAQWHNGQSEPGKTVCITVSQLYNSCSYESIVHLRLTLLSQ